MKQAFIGSWLAALYVAGPISAILLALTVIAYAIQGDFGMMLAMGLFGWIPAAIWTVLIAIPLGIIFMGFAFTYKAARFWWEHLPFRVTR